MFSNVRTDRQENERRVWPNLMMAGLQLTRFGLGLTDPRLGGETKLIVFMVLRMHLLVNASFCLCMIRFVKWEMAIEFQLLIFICRYLIDLCLLSWL